MSVPVFKGSWWVLPGGLLAGPAPIDPSKDTDLKKLLDYGVRGFVDLREPKEKFGGVVVSQYVGKLLDDCVYKNYPIVDGSVPKSVHDLDRIVLAVDELISEPRLTYIHCHGGHGRTGLVVACWLVFRGMSSSEALKEIFRLRSEASSFLVKIPSPQTFAQVEMVLAYEAFLIQEGRFVGRSGELLSGV